MLIPSVDLRGGNAVQLIGGKELAIDAGDPRPIARRFGRVGPVAVIDLDAALGTGSNAETIRALLPLCRARVGGGIRSVESARRWLDAGAEAVILGTAARPEILSELPRDRVIAALDAVHGEVVVKGWTEKTGTTVLERMAALRPYVGGFLVTFVEREGRMAGIDLEAVKALVEAAGDTQLTVAGGVATPEDIAMLDRLGVDAQVGMALYRGDISLAEGFLAPATSDRPDGLFPTVITDERGVALGLAYTTLESATAALERGRGVYWSRKRGLWEKGATSGAGQELVSVALDCDRDTLRFTVKQADPGFCHTATRTCWGADRGLGRLDRTLAERVTAPPPGSYTARLLSDPDLLRAKLLEEAGELADARTTDEVTWETADLIYFALVRARAAGVDLGAVERELDRRAGVTTRRPGNAKAPSEPEQRSSLRRISPDAVPSLRRDPVDAETLAGAGKIVDDVRDRGEEALVDWATRFGDLQGPLVIGKEGLAAAVAQISPEDRALLERTADRIRTFAVAQRERIGNTDIPIPGGRAGLRMQPVARAGCYAPGGRFPLPSSVLMTAVTARVAGVEEVWVASPRPSPITLAAAAIAGADAVLTVGGAQAIAALAYGAGPVPACDAIVGPGNRWVTAAKQRVAGRVAIDMLAGPSELVVIADASADPALIAADLLAQAEHDPDAVPILIATADILDAVDAAIADQLQTLPTAEIARAALVNGFAVRTSDLAEACAISDQIAPEHLALHLTDLDGARRLLRHYGAVFVGEGAAEVLGDYGAGPNHVLPTGGTARSVGGLSVLTFLRNQTWLQMDAPEEIAADAVRLARLEGLEAHARAAELRA